MAKKRNLAREWVEGVVSRTSKATLGVLNTPLAFQLLDMRGFDAKCIPHPLTATRKMGQCYKNCFELSMQFPELIYCEGFAQSPHLPIALEHAWLLTPEGEIVDPTWRDTKTHYFGCAFRPEGLQSIAEVTQVYGVLGVLYKFRKSPEQVLDILIESTYDRAELPI